ncbi:MAG: glycosyl transferase [Alphaproteobacteria bacterium HGW-Alphaproteobacteria-16]|nr:MAG: glycosyl transferase [Alphaproteobacteria bacterium HGW-Alphaproteobacteria-16]
MRVLHLIGTLDPTSGGVAQCVLQLSEVWDEMGHNSAIASLDAPDNDFLGQIRFDTFGLASVPSQADRKPLSLIERFGYSPDYVPWLRQHVADYDLVLVHGLWNYLSIGASRVLPGGSTPYAVLPHGMLDPWFKRQRIKHAVKSMLWPFFEGKLLREASAVLFTTEEERELAAQSFRPYAVRARITPIGAEDVEPAPERQIAAFHAQVPGLASQPFLLFMSRIHPKKGCDMLIEAYADLVASGTDLNLVIAGPDQTGWRDTLEQIARSRGVADRIVWPGMLSGDAKWGAFRSAEAFILPSHQENFGIVVPEAMSCSRPVLITNKVNLWREVEADGAGLICNDNRADIAAQLAAFNAMSPALRAQMGANARTSFEQRFRFKDAAVAMMRLFEEELVR